MIVTSARLLRLLTLLQSRGFWTGPELAERLEITERTVRRDVDRLRTLGYPIRSSAGVAGGYQLGGGTSLPPLLLEDDEALAVTLGLRTAATGGVSGLAESAVRALTKLEQLMPARLRRRVNALQTVEPLVRDEAQVDAAILSALASACRNLERASFRYDDANGRTTRRRVEPHGVVHTGARWYLVGWDEVRDDWRTFRIDRISGPIRAGTRFTPRPVPEGSAARFVGRRIASSPYPCRGRVEFLAPASRVAPGIPPSAGHVEPIDETRCSLEAGASSWTRLALYITLVDEDFEVIEPPELRAEVRRLGARLRRATRSSGQSP